MNENEKQQILNQANSLGANIEEMNQYDTKVLELKECPNCKTKIKSGVFSDITMFSKKSVDFINEFTANSSEYYCTKCGEKLLIAAKKNIQSHIFDYECKLSNAIDNIPVITIQNPHNWNYEIVDMVTAQNTTGTGVFFELSTSIDDLLGNKSDRYNSKTKEGENICKKMLRINAIRLGANAVIGTDIDYTEVGGSKALFMICMAGTAVKLKNIEILGQEKAESISNYNAIKEKIKYLNTLL
jgi:uncharacterized protein YbjQ (UPF0145 family)/DNA-directed RNA polymerase subunit RPC12/RpoP